MTPLGNCCTRIYTMTFGGCFRPSAKKKLEQTCNNVAEDRLTHQRNGPVNAKNRKMQQIHDPISRGERIRQASVKRYEEDLAKQGRSPINASVRITAQIKDSESPDTIALNNWCAKIYAMKVGKFFVIRKLQWIDSNAYKGSLDSLTAFCKNILGAKKTEPLKIKQQTLIDLQKRNQTLKQERQAAYDASSTAIVHYFDLANRIARE